MIKEEGLSIRHELQETKSKKKMERQHVALSIYIRLVINRHSTKFKSVLIKQEFSKENFEKMINDPSSPLYLQIKEEEAAIKCFVNLLELRRYKRFYISGIAKLFSEFVSVGYIDLVDSYLKQELQSSISAYSWNMNAIMNWQKDYSGLLVHLKDMNDRVTKIPELQEIVESIYDQESKLYQGAKTLGDITPLYFLQNHTPNTETKYAMDVLTDFFIKKCQNDLMLNLSHSKKD